MIVLKARLFLLVLLVLYTLPVPAQVRVEEVNYADAGVALRGYLAWDDSIQGARPGILVVHEWWGLNDYVRSRARRLARAGYVAFALDMYGEGKSTTHPGDAKSWSSEIVSNLARWQQRALAGLEVLRRAPYTDPERLAAIGYCFGGATVMQLAYAGAPLRAVVSFHGSLPVARDDQLGNISARILAAHGAADTFVPRERITRFQQQLEKAGADWQMVIYSGARHGFTNPGAARYGIANIRYHATADRRSWALMQHFLRSAFESP